MGEIITFYSFKGGVGRTMAMANVGFIAALNGKRVLLVDWDLEAPGLEYYFRGLTDRNSEVAFKDAPGILNILTSWSNSVRTDMDESELTRIRNRHETGAAFAEAARPLVEPALCSELFPSKSRLDIIGAGSRTFDENVMYEEALSAFSWPNFFTDSGGGYLLQCFQSWARENYDVILIDSRTGLADAAGICTLLLPDSVALCFALNHQNIEGVARVAKSIHSSSVGAIKIRPIPMRVARRDSSESSDAQARALSALANTAGLPSAQTKKDLQSLYIAFDDNLPFYETLAPFVSPDPTIDPLCVSYVRLVKALIDPSAIMPKISSDVIARVKARLSPRNATAEYVSELVSADTDRAFAEFQRLVDMAYSTVLETELIDHNYVLALFHGAADLVNRVDDIDAGMRLLIQAAEVIRLLAQRRPEDWHRQYLMAAEDVINVSSIYGRTDEEIALRRELDKYLLPHGEIDDRLIRLSNLNELARSLHSQRKKSELIEIIQRMVELLESFVDESLNDDQERSLLVSIANIALLNGESAASTGQLAEAQASFENGLRKIERAARIEGNSELQRQKLNLHIALATLPGISSELVGLHSIAAADTNMPEFAMHFNTLARHVLAINNNPQITIEFCQRSFAVTMRRRIIAQYSRNSLRVVELLHLIRDFVKLMDKEEAGISAGVFEVLVVAFSETLQAIAKARYKLTSSNALRAERLSEEVIARVQRRESIETSVVDSLVNAFIEFKQRMSES